MWIQSLKKIISGILLLSLFFSITVRIPLEYIFFVRWYADTKEFHNIVSLIVEENIYDDISSKLLRYSRDVQAVLENTRVVILPTPSNASPLDIASLNESLYFEWYKSVQSGVDFESRLIGTVIVGDIPIPTVYQWWSQSKTLLPYIDFEDKSYIYDHDTGKYEENLDANWAISAEIWHGVISPNTWSESENIQALEDYFDKNHDFYTWNGVFDQDLWVLSGDANSAPSDYEPYVFYYDQFRENAGLQYEEYVGYQAYLENIEDITYNRYSKELAEKIKDQVLGIQNQNIADLIANVDPDFDISSFSSWPDVEASSDVLTRYITDNSTNKFLEIFNSSTLSDMRKHVYNAGRYNDWGSRVNVDMPPFLISVLDQVSSEVIKNVNTVLEEEITDLVANGLSREIAIPVNISESSGSPIQCPDVYTSYYYGQLAEDITTASQCSIYRWSVENNGTLTESNRWYNINNAWPDTALCGQWMRYDTVEWRISEGLSGFWWNNSPVNLDANDGNYSSFNLGTTNLKWWIRPVYDVLWSKEIDDATKVPSPVDCIQEGVMIHTYNTFVHSYETGGEDGETNYICRMAFDLPIRSWDSVKYYTQYGSQSAVEWIETRPTGTTSTSRFCAADNSFATPAQDFSSIIWSGLSIETCTIKTASLWWTIVASGTDPNINSVRWGFEESEPVCPIKYTKSYNYKSIPSHILHTSPTDSEFWLQTQALFTPSLPIDKNRYIDFIGANGQWADFGYQRIDFPTLFRVSLDPSEEITLDNIDLATKNHLDNISAQINTVIVNSDPSTLSGDALTVYNLLSTWAFPTADFDLYQFLQDKPLEVFDSNNQSKEISYYDTLVFSIFWNNLNSPSAKYKFIFDEYLSNEFTGNDYGFHLPKAKKSYEIWYFAAPGDAQNMYVKIDPEQKGIHPYADILSANLSLQTTLLSANAADPREIEGVFECAPPDGVNIFQWIPAVICWLQEMLPPTIEIGPWACWSNDLFTEEEYAEIEACQWDANKNGIIDCIEEQLVWGTLSLNSDASRYYYNSSWVLRTEILTNEWRLARFDSVSYIQTNLERVEVPANPEEAFGVGNIRVVYDASIPELSDEEALENAAAYVSFRDTIVRAIWGESQSYFYLKGQDANVYFRSSLEHKDTSGNTIVELQSLEKKLEIRGDRIIVSSYEVSDEVEVGSSITVSDQSNICIVDSGGTNHANYSTAVRSVSSAEEKLLLLIENFSKTGNILELNYPLYIRLTKAWEIVYEQQNILEWEIDAVLPIFAARESWRYELQVRDNLWFISTRLLDFAADTAVDLDINLGTTIVETGGNISTHLVSIFDQYDNLASSEVYDIEMNISWGWLRFLSNNSTELNLTTIDGFISLRLVSTEVPWTNTLSVTLKNIAGEVIAERDVNIRNIEVIDMSMNPLDGNPVVWWEEVSYEVQFRDVAGNILTDLDSRVYFSFPRIYGTPTRSYFEVENGVAEISFIPGTLAAESIDVELQLEGWRNIYVEEITIVPEDPIRIDLSLSRDKIEASSEASSLLNATLKDRYDNDVFTDNITSLELGIHDSSVWIISSTDASKQVNKWRTQFRIYGKETPWTAYFNVSSDPLLEDNSFTLEWQAPFDKTRLTIPTMLDGSGSLTPTGDRFFSEFSDSKFITRYISKSLLEASDSYNALPNSIQNQLSDFWDETNGLEVSGISSNAGTIETFFFWDKNDIEGNAYNTMYSMLLWGPYGDITQENYLAWSLIFDRDNNALSATSLLQDPYKFHDVFAITSSWALEQNKSYDITQDIEITPTINSNGMLVYDFYNEVLDDYIWRAYYNIVDAEDVILEIQADSWYFWNSEAGVTSIVDDQWRKIFDVTSGGRFRKYAGTSLLMWDFWKVSIYHNDTYVWNIVVSETELSLEVTREDSILTSKLSVVEDSFIFHLQSNTYSTRIIESDIWARRIQVYYHDPFAVKYSLDEFHAGEIVGIEASYDEAGIGWQDSNRALLSFAAWESVWDATKHFTSFSLINIWDPVISLKPVQKIFSGTSTEKSFDPTLWEIIEKDSDLIGYQVFDYNNDTRKDILTIHRDGYLKLYERRDLEGDYVYHRSYWFAADGGSVYRVKTWDFSWDGYGDIFFVDIDGNPALFNNVEKDITRYDILWDFSLSGSILQAEVYDMDVDGKDDIVTLDTAGEIHIFYGWWTPEDPQFTQKYIWDGYAITLSDTEISHGWAIYFDGLTQIPDNRATEILANSSEYLSELEASIAASGEGGFDAPDVEFIDNSLVDRFLYESLPYRPVQWPDSEIALGNFREQIASIDGSSDDVDLSSSDESIAEFVENYDSYISYTWFQNNYNISTYFLRSQYADLEWIEITKTFTDTTPPNLQSWDRVYFDIRIQNTSSSVKSNMAYVDSLPEFFRFATDDFEVLSEDGRRIDRWYGIAWYEIVVDGFSLDPGEETVIRFELEALPFNYGHIQVGLYEAWELGDDVYGDILIKDDYENCWWEADIYRSTAVRSYEKWVTAPSCNEADVDIWNNFPELDDDNNNGIPDYLENLLEEDAQWNIVPTSDNAALQDYANEVLDDFRTDSDGDGIPDDDDSAPNTDSATDFMWALENINEAIDDISGEIDTLIEWLSCGFWGGSCFANPLNWAPLAPWNDPTLYGMPIGDGLHVNEWNPIFSALTGRQASCGLSPCCLPSVYPATSQAFIPWPFCGAPSAGWRLGTWASTNFVRLYVTPTLTGWVWLAACFGGPAIAAWNANPIGAHPIVPGWNCIVAAMPLLGCEWDEWDPWVEGYPYPWGDFSVIHANCSWPRAWGELSTPLELESQFVLDYLNYQRSGVQPAGMYDRYLEVFERVSEGNSGNYALPTEPLINIGSWEGTMSASITLDTSALASGNFGDVVQVENTQIDAFPWFLMNWVERQLDEITSKLTNLPKIMVILPDFWGIFDYSWEWFGEGLSEAFQDGKNTAAEERSESDSQIESLRNTRSSLDCSWEDRIQCAQLDLQIGSEWGQRYVNSGRETLSWIKEVYEFIGNVPLVNVETETIHVNIPWPDPNELERALVDWKLSLELYKEEIQNASNDWSLWATCTGTEAEIARCQQQNEIGDNLLIQSWKFIDSLETNIWILEEYKEFPDRLADLINIKEVWLEQILCNIEAISSLVWEWISTNGERFKAWVELYILIKAILKSWQLFVDVFNGYEAECHECKNERQDLQNFLFQLVSAVIPSPPIIEFPKWPDIIVDLHNIRAGINVYLPDFKLNKRPIVLPTLPTLNLPRVPTVAVDIPALPLLPRFEIPELPELPSLPTVELPDLPPPPKIPKLFGAVEWVLNIAKLVTKVMCILKNSPFVPEWRAGDQIAFLTERNWYLPTDFINIQPPTFSYSAISAIKVTTYVNFEFEMEFILEAVRAVTAPLDDATNNIVNMFDISLSNIDLSNVVPENIDIEVGGGTSIDGRDTGLLDPLDANPEGIYVLAEIFAQSFIKLLGYTQDNVDETLSNTEFKHYVWQWLASRSFTEDQRTEDIRRLWEGVSNINFSKEDAFIEEMLQNNTSKFEALWDILSTEIEYSKQQKHEIGTFELSDTFIKTSDTTDDRGIEYQNIMEEYNLKTLEAAVQLVEWPSEETQTFESEIKAEWESFMNEIRGWLQSYKENSLLAAVPSLDSWASAGSCNASWAYQYNYEGIYVKEDGRNYRLFDYTDLLIGHEIPVIEDMDNDGDNDVLYLMDGTLYFKENRKNTSSTIHLPTPLILGVNDNQFYNGDVYYEAVNGFIESWVSDGAINISFAKPTNTELKNFRLEYHTLIDRYIDDGNNLPPNFETHIVDALSDIDQRPVLEVGENHNIYFNEAVLTYVWANANLTLTNDKLINIKDDLIENSKVVITRNTPLYAGPNNFTIEYQFWANSDVEILRVPAYAQVQFDRAADIIALSGDAYVSLGIQEDIVGTDIIDYIGMPLLPWSHSEFDGDTSLLGTSDHMDIRYYDGTEREIDFRDVKSYRLYDLWESRGEEHVIRLEVPNDFYYARLAAMKDDILSTWSRQILLSPQSYSDTHPPQIALGQKIRIPVYQRETVDITPYIYEDWGLSGIVDVRIDDDTSVDTNGDSDPKNDRDTAGINIVRTPAKIEIEFGPFDYLIDKTILVALTDDNGNIGTAEVPFEIYAPEPNINNVEGTQIYGRLDENLSQEPVRIYRYRWWTVERLEQIDGSWLALTSNTGAYDFTASQDTDGLTLSYSGRILATIDEYTGRIDIADIFTSTRVLPSNNPLNTEAFPEVQVLLAWNPIFRQFFKLPSWNIILSGDISEREEEWIYIRLIDQVTYNSFQIPLSASYNPWSTSIYRSDDSDQTPVITLFRDGRINIDESVYRLDYRTYWEDAAFVLVEIASWAEIAEIVYETEANYILR